MIGYSNSACSEDKQLNGWVTASSVHKEASMLRICHEEITNRPDMAVITKPNNQNHNKNILMGTSRYIAHRFFDNDIEIYSYNSLEA